ncbi:MAG TPA: acyltransferase [Candidatus Angelobacter sp.]
MVKNSYQQRVQGIDVLRGLCIIAVVVHHINLRFRFDKTLVGGGKLFPSAVLFWSGYYGVRVFFVISGFLIAGWSLKRWGALNKLSLRQFYAMRFARIIPCLLAVLLVFSTLHLTGAPRFVINRPHQSLPRALFAALTFHINWLEAKTGYLPGGWDPLWSLSVEEVFYIFFPLLCLILRKGWFLVLLLAGFVVVGPVARTLIQSDPWVDYSYFSCMDGIALGCLAAMLSVKIKFSVKANRALLASGAFLLIFIEVFRHAQASLGLYKVGLDVTVLQVGTALLIIALQQRFEKNAPAGHWSTGWLRWFGRNSYEVYLTHMLVVWPMVGIYFRLHQSPNMAALWFVPITALTGLLGYVVARFYSEPLNGELRRRLPSASSGVASGAASCDRF